MTANLLTLGILLALAVGLIAYSLMPRRRDERDIVKRRLWGRHSVNEQAEIRDRARDSAAGDFVRKAAPMLSKLIMPTSDEAQSNLRIKLANAGFRQPQAQTLLLSSKSALAVIGLASAPPVAWLPISSSSRSRAWSPAVRAPAS